MCVICICWIWHYSHFAQFIFSATANNYCICIVMCFPWGEIKLIYKRSLYQCVCVRRRAAPITTGWWQVRPVQQSTVLKRCSSSTKHTSTSASAEAASRPPEVASASCTTGSVHRPRIDRDVVKVVDISISSNFAQLLYQHVSFAFAFLWAHLRNFV